MFGHERRTLGQREVPGQGERTPSSGAESRRLTGAGDDDLELLEGRKRVPFPLPARGCFHSKLSIPGCVPQTSHSPVLS